MRGAAVLLALALCSGRASAQASGLQRGVIVEPESVTVGDPFRVVLRVRAPLGATIEFPAGPDTAAKVEPLDPVVVVTANDTTAVEQTATYRLAAWDTGRLPVRFGDVVVREGNRVRRIAAGDLTILVVSVLPADSALHVPKPARAVFTFGPPWWWWLLVALAAAALGLLFWWWWRRRQHGGAAIVDPYDEALAAFARIDALGLLGAGEIGQHAALHADVVRTYLSRELRAARTSLTTTELLHALRGEDRVSLVRLQRLLHEADLVKFAGQAIPAARALELGREARALVDAVHLAKHPPEERKAAA